MSGAWRDDLTAALPGWVAARAVVLSTLAVAHVLVDHRAVHGAGAAGTVRAGLLSWDAAFYRGIASHGYGIGTFPHEALRFFPLYPLAGRALSVPFGGRTDVALLVLANAGALCAAALLHRLVLVEGGSPALARRAAWLLSLAPPAFVLVMGYAESLFLVLVVAAFLALRTTRWWSAAALALLAGLCRPVGVLVAVPALVEVVRGWSERRAGHSMHRAALPSVWRRAGQLAAIAGGPAGTGAFLVWSGVRYGDARLPMRIQQDRRLRGRLVDPLTALVHEARGVVHGHHLASALHVPWALVLVALVVVCFRRWPASYGAFCLVVLAVALSSDNLDSLERYALSAFPFVLAAAVLCRTRLLERAVLALGAAAMAGYAMLAFLDVLVP